jgi:hypothetical protein
MFTQPDNASHFLGLPLEIILVGLLGLGLFLGLFLAKWRIQRRMNVNRRTGHRGEAVALDLLERAGFDIVTTQASANIEVEVDGTIRSYQVRADALARKNGQDFLVEIKGTNTSADVSNRTTRRQLLEYATTFDVDDCLLVNAEKGTIQVIRFPALADTN